MYIPLCPTLMREQVTTSSNMSVLLEDAVEEFELVEEYLAESSIALNPVTIRLATPADVPLIRLEIDTWIVKQEELLTKGAQIDDKGIQALIHLAAFYQLRRLSEATHDTDSALIRVVNTALDRLNRNKQAVNELRGKELEGGE